MTVKKATRFILSVLLVAGLAAGGYWFLRRTQPEDCRICQRPIHAEARAVITVDGQREAVCCARCAFTFRQQKHAPVRLVEVTDYVSGQPLAPAAAYFVEGSRVVVCAAHESLLDQTKHPYERVFDRCVPSLYAFARHEDAEAFAARNGGRVRGLAELLEEVEARP